MTGGDIFVLVLVAVGAFFAVRSVLRDRKNGGCGGNCAGCSGCGGAFSPDQNQEEPPEKHS